MDDALAAAVRAHVAAFNSAVRSGEWAAFADGFAEDAVMRFTNVPAGPFVGRAAILAGYQARPPADTMTVDGIEGIESGGALVGFTWDADGPGSMILRWSAGLVQELVITFG